MTQQHSSPNVEQNPAGKGPLIRPESPWNFVLWFLIIVIVAVLVVYAVYAGV